MTLITNWDPIGYVADTTRFSEMCTRRIKRDIASLIQAPPSGVTVHINEEDFTVVHAIITGASGTPYSGGFFYFLVKCTADYPICPPKVRLMTTGAGTVRFHPNFYSDGKVCLSILGTWFGPGWLPSNTIEGVLISIQSVMTENPIYNEPGFNEEVMGPSAVEDYNLYIATETLDAAVAGMLEETNLPQPLQHYIQATFLENFQMYEDLAIKNKEQVPKLKKVWLNFIMYTAMVTSFSRHYWSPEVWSGCILLADISALSSLMIHSQNLEL